MTVTVYSAKKLAPTDIQKIRYIMKAAKKDHTDTCLYNTFPGWFDHRDGENLYFDAGKRRRYCEKIIVGE